MHVEQPLFTVATVTYNSGKWVRQAIESVLASSYSSFEYIIADDCSSDDTWKIVNNYKDSRIVAMRHDKNIGEYANRNAVVKSAKGRYLLFVDGDDVLLKHTLRNLAEYIEAFPNAQTIWGVQPANIDFAIMPYVFESHELIRLIYGTTLPLAVIGFAETVFRVEELRAAGGLSQKYSIGDTYIKKKLALTCNALFVPMGFVFWRRSSNQASSRVNQDYRNFLEGYLIDCEIMQSYDADEKQDLELSIRGSFIRRLLKNTLLKGKYSDFIQLYKKAGLRLRDISLLFKRYTYHYSPVERTDEPLVNSFNFSDKL
ncbi:glycosyltransferase family 2 protein [Lacibacter luteus]|uniref:Glycosyltransferase family 2 protein n=1 Tax=Lacibacter luteus TaxID=2508719 RepID=A0A4Q1CD10_9BACT|nr:glycosyltransferase family 2 protein [Lacibacter luteus]RXK57425.1 glycosyltransferase family 2 protein [Lacibacter luteus]